MKVAFFRLAAQFHPPSSQCAHYLLFLFVDLVAPVGQRRWHSRAHHGPYKGACCPGAPPFRHFLQIHFGARPPILQFCDCELKIPGLESNVFSLVNRSKLLRGRLRAGPTIGWCVNMRPFPSFVGPQVGVCGLASNVPRSPSRPPFFYFLPHCPLPGGRRSNGWPAEGERKGTTEEGRSDPCRHPRATPRSPHLHHRFQSLAPLVARPG